MCRAKSCKVTLRLRRAAMARSGTRSRRTPGGTGLGRFIRRALLLCVAAGALYVAYLAWRVGHEFEGRRWDLPAQVYAAPLELYAGRTLSADDLVDELARLGYHEDPRLPSAGSYRVGLDRLPRHGE